jgi:heme exporter protein C
MFAANNHRISITGVAVSAGVTALVTAALWSIFFVAPTEVSMGDVQRIIYLHVAVAWCGLAAMIALGLCGGAYLVTRRLRWDFWAQALCEVGCLCTFLTLVTGSAWAHEAWGTWWTWEPRLTSSLVMWIMYCGMLLIRSSVDEPHRRARVGAVLAIIGIGDVPLVLMATRWFRGVHPVSPDMDPTMRMVLLASLISFTVLFAFLTTVRRRQLEIADQVAELEAVTLRTR